MNDNQPLRLSVALVTRNRPDSMERWLISIASQTAPPFEIVVSDDSDELYQETVRTLCATFGCRYIQGPRRGLYANRNCAAIACHGTHIFSADDDHTHPSDYLETALRLINSDAARIWILGERWPDRPDLGASCPPELHRSGRGQAPKDTGSCAAIADGATVYPRAIFERGFRYDEAYSFGPMWYLWGKTLSRAGWRITYSDETYVIHHLREALATRHFDIGFIQRQHEATLYAAWVNAFCFEPGMLAFSYCVLRTLRMILFPDGEVEVRGVARLPLEGA